MRDSPGDILQFRVSVSGVALPDVKERCCRTKIEISASRDLALGNAAELGLEDHIYDGLWDQKSIIIWYMDPLEKVFGLLFLAF